MSVAPVLREAPDELIKTSQFRDKRAFDCYNLYFAKREEALAIFEEEVTKSGKSGFGAYIDVSTNLLLLFSRCSMFFRESNTLLRISGTGSVFVNC
jgi:hypothetical protein